MPPAPTSPCPVLLPIPAAVWGPRSSKPVVGHVWVEREVDVPVLRSDARCRVAHQDERGVLRAMADGTCADGIHRRTLVPSPTHGGRYAPFALVDVPGATERGSFRVVRCDSLPGTTPLGPAPDDGGVLAASSVLSAGHTITMARQSTLKARHGDGRPDGAHGFPVPSNDRASAGDGFALAPGRRWRALDPDFEVRLLDALARDLALVDGEPAMRAPRPCVVVSVGPYSRDRTVKVSVVYPDLVETPFYDVHLVLPWEALGWIDGELRDAMDAGGPLAGVDRVAPPLAPPPEGSVVAPPPPDEILRTRNRRVARPCVQLQHALRRWGLDLVRRHSPAPPSAPTLDTSPLDALPSFGA